MPYLDELPVAPSVATTDILPVCQGSTGAPGSGTDRQGTIAKLAAAIAGTTLPLIEGTASVGVSNFFARADHVHPAGGGGGLTPPGGSPGQVQFNNAGAFGGLSNAALTALVQDFGTSTSGAVPAPGSVTGRVLSDSGWTTPAATTLAPYNWFNVMDYGAAGNGTTNDTAAFNAAMAAAGAMGAGVVWIPNGTYLLDPITVPANVVLSGTTSGPLDPGPTFLTSPIGATLLVNSHATPFITMNNPACLQDVIIYDPGQVAPSAAAPTAFPATVYIGSTCKVRRVTICNPYIGIQIRCGRTFVEDCLIGAYSTGIDVDNTADVVVLQNVFCGAFYETCVGLVPPQIIDTWCLNNRVAFKFARGDAMFMINCSAFYSRVGLNLVSGATGASYGKAINLDFDTCTYGILAQATNVTGGGWKILDADIGSSGVGVFPGVTAQTALWLATGGPGGVQAPIVEWIAGSVRGDWQYGPVQVSTGTATVRFVTGIPDTVSSGIVVSVPLTTTSVIAITSIVLDAGTWDLWGFVSIAPTGTTLVQVMGAVNDSTSVPAGATGQQNAFYGSFPGPMNIPAGHAVVTCTTSTQYYLLARADFIGGSVSAGGYIGAHKI